MRYGMLAVLSSLSLMLACNGGTAAGGSTDGKSVFQEVCSRCHGPGGVPSAAMVARTGVKNLTDTALQDRMDVAAIEKQVRNGSKNRQMPAFQGALSNKQIAAVAAYVKTLDPRAATASEAATQSE
jgi:mono/diheme cytochrome c family protein